MDSIPMLEPMSEWATSSLHQMDEEKRGTPMELIDGQTTNRMELDLNQSAMMSEDESDEQTPRHHIRTKIEPIDSSTNTATQSTASKVGITSTKGRRAVMRELASYEVIDLALSSDEDSDVEVIRKTVRPKPTIRHDYPPVEIFPIDLRQSRVVSGRALRREMLPAFYPPSPPPAPREEEKEEEEEKTNTPSGTKKKSRKKRSREPIPDYYDCSDAFIDDSELIDDADGEDEDGDQQPHSLTPAQLHALYDTFMVTSAAAIELDQQAQVKLATKLEEDRQKRKQKRKDGKEGATQTGKDGKDKSSKPKATATTSDQVATATKKKKDGKEKEKEKETEKTVTEKSPSTSTTAKKDGAGPTGEKRKRHRKDAASEKELTPALPPPDLGTLDKDWLICFERFAATPAMITLLEEIMAEYKQYQQSTLNQSPPNTTTSTTPTQIQPGVSSPAPSSSTPMEIESEHKENTVDLTNETLEPPATPSGATDSAGMKSSRLRHKTAASLVAHKAPTKMPEIFMKLLGRLGSLLEKQGAEEAIVNKFIGVLTLKLIWSRKLIKDRLTIGRLEGQLSVYLKERFELYIKLREAVKADIDAQAAKLDTDAQGDTNMDTDSSTSTLASTYRPNWDSYMPLLLDYTTYTDDIEEAIEELEEVFPKRIKEVLDEVGTPADTTAQVDERASVIQSLWSDLDISSHLYPPIHLPLVQSLCKTVYATLPALWIYSPTSPSLMTESVIETTIDAAESAAQAEALRKEAEEKAAAEAAAEEARRIAEAERLKAEEAARAAQEQQDREVEEILAQEQQRKADKAARLAAAQAAAAAAASEHPASPKPKKSTAASSATGGGVGPDGEPKKRGRKPKQRDPTIPLRSSTFAQLPPLPDRWKPATTVPSSPLVKPTKPPKPPTQLPTPITSTPSLTQPPSTSASGQPTPVRNESTSAAPVTNGPSPFQYGVFPAYPHLPNNFASMTMAETMMQQSMMHQAMMNQAAAAHQALFFQQQSAMAAAAAANPNHTQPTPSVTMAIAHQPTAAPLLPPIDPSVYQTTTTTPAAMTSTPLSEWATDSH